MRILIDVRLLSRGGSGIHEYTRCLVHALIREAPEHTFILWNNSFRSRELPSSLLQFPNVITANLRIPNTLLHFSSRFLRAPNIARLFGADVVLSPHFDNLETGKTPRILVLHDLSFLHYPHFFSPRQRFWHWLQGYRSQALRAAHIVTDVEYTKADIVKTFSISPERISVIHPGIPLSSAPPSPEVITAFRARRGLREPFFLYLGTLEPRKNIIGIIDAFSAAKKDSALADYKLLIAGRPGWLYRPIFAHASRSRVKNDILFIGPVTADEKPILYAASDCFIYPSFFEGFGFPPLEAQLSGTPIIASSRSSFPETLEESAPLVDPWRTHELTDCMRRIVKDKEYARSLRERGFENARRFSWEDAARSFLSLATDLVENRRK